MAQNIMFRTILRPTLWRDERPTPTEQYECGRGRPVANSAAGAAQPSSRGSATFRSSSSREPLS